MPRPRPIYILLFVAVVLWLLAAWFDSRPLALGGVLAMALAAIGAWRGLKSIKWLSVLLPAFALVAAAPPAEADQSCVATDQVLVVLEAWEQRGLGAAERLDTNDTARWLAAFNAEPPVSEAAADIAILFTFWRDTPHRRYGLMRPHAVIAILFTDGCAIGTVMAHPATAKRIRLKALGAPT